MAGTLADVFVRVRGETSDLKKDIETAGSTSSAESGKKSGKKFAAGFSGQIKRLATTVGATLAGIQVYKFFKSTVEAAQEGLAVQRQTEAVLKSTGEAAHVSASKVEEYSAAIADSAGLTETTVQAGANLALTFTNVRDEAGRGNDIFRQYLQASVDVSSALHQQLQPSLIQLGKALNDPATGMNNLRRVGVSFTAQQIKQAQELQKNGNLLGAQKIILRELSHEFAGAAAAGADPITRAKAAWENFEDELGRRLIPTVEDLAISFQQFLPTLADFAQRFADSITEVFRFVSENKDLIAILLGAAAAIRVLTTALAAVKAVHEAWLVITLAENAALTANVIAVIVLAIAALVAGIIYAYRHSEKFRAIVQGTFHAIQVAAQAVADFFVKTIPHAWDVVYENTVRTFQAVRNWLARYWPLILAIIAGPVGLIVLLVVKNWDKIVGFFRELPGRILAVLKALPGLLLGLVARIASGLLYETGYAIGLYIKAWLVLPPKIIGLIRDMFVALYHGFINGMKLLLAYWVNGWREILHQFTPGQIVANVSALWNFLINVFARGVLRILAAMAKWANGSIAAARNLGVGVLSAIGQAVNGAISYLLQLPNRGIAAILSLRNSIKSAASGARSWLFQAGKDLLSGLISGIGAALGGAISAAKNAMKRILQGAKDALGSHSPSTEFAKLGEDSIAGYTLGQFHPRPEVLARVMGHPQPPVAAATTFNYSPTYRVPNPINPEQLARYSLAQLAFALSTGVIRAR